MCASDRIVLSPEPLGPVTLTPLCADAVKGRAGETNEKKKKIGRKPPSPSPASA